MKKFPWLKVIAALLFIACAVALVIVLLDRDALDRKLTEKAAERDRLNISLINVSYERDSVIKELASAAEDNAKVREDLAAAVQKGAELSAALADMTAKNENLQQDLITGAAERERAETEYTQVIQALQTAAEEKDASIAELQTRNAELKGVEEELTRTVSGLTADIEKAEAEAAAMADEAEDLYVALAERNITVSVTRELLAASEDKCLELAVSLADITAQKETLGTELLSLSEKLTEKEAEIAAYKDQAAEAARDFAAALKIKANELSDLYLLVSEQNASLSLTEGKLKDKTAECGAREAQIVDLQAEAETLSADLAEAESLLNSAREAYITLRATADQIQKLADTLAADNAALNADKEEIAAIAADAIAALTAEKAEIAAAAETSIAALTAKKDEAAAKAAGMEKEIDELYRALSTDNAALSLSSGKLKNANETIEKLEAERDSLRDIEAGLAARIQALEERLTLAEEIFRGIIGDSMEDDAPLNMIRDFLSLSQTDLPETE